MGRPKANPDKAEKYAELILRSGRVIYRHYKKTGSVENMFESSDAVVTMAKATGPVLLEVVSDVLKKSARATKAAADVAKAEATKAAADVLKKSTEATKAAADAVKKSAEATNAAADVLKKSAEVTEAAADVVKKSAEATKAAADVLKKSTDATKAAADAVKKSAEATNAAADVLKKSTEVTEAAADVVKKTAEATKAKSNASILPDVVRLLPGVIDVATTIKAAVEKDADGEPAKTAEEKFWRPVKAAALLAADIASINREAVTKAIPGTTLTATTKFNECAIKFSKGSKLSKIGAMKFNLVEAALGGAHAVYKDAVNGTLDNTAEFAGGFAGKMGGQLAGRALGGE